MMFKVVSAVNFTKYFITWKKKYLHVFQIPPQVACACLSTAWCEQDFQKLLLKENVGDCLPSPWGGEEHVLLMFKAGWQVHWAIKDKPFFGFQTLFWATNKSEDKPDRHYKKLLTMLFHGQMICTRTCFLCEKLWFICMRSKWSACPHRCDLAAHDVENDHC